MEVKVIKFIALLSISKCVFSAVQPIDASNQRNFHQVNYARFPIENKRPLPQINFLDNINNQHVYNQNNLPINPPFNIFQNYRQLPDRERIQLNPISNVQKKNVRLNNILTNGINERNSQIEQKTQLPIVNQRLLDPQLFAIKNRQLGGNARSPFDNEPNRRLINTKPLMVYNVPPEIKKNVVRNDRARQSVNQDYKRYLVPPNNAKIALHLGNNNKNMDQQKVLPIQQPVANKRYTFIRKNGAVEHYDNLEVLLKKYPHVKLPLNVQAPQTPGVNKDIKSTENIRPSHLTEPYANLNIPLNQYNSNIAAPNGKDSFTGFQKQASQNTAIISANRQDDRYLLTRNPVAKTSLIENKMPSKDNQNDNIMHLTNQAKNSLNNFKEVQSKNNPHTEILLDQVKSVKENPDTILPTKNVTKQEKSPILTMVNKYEKPLNYTIIPETNPTKENITTETTTSGLKNCSLDLKAQSNNNLDKNKTTVDNDGKLFEVGNPTGTISNVTKLKSTSNSLEQKERHEIAAQEDRNEDSLNKPVFWFTTNDPNFWDKLVEDSASNYVYVINVQSRPKVEKDTKTIVHANGTIVEEITESVWEDDDESPKITKTVKITPAAEITKEKIVAEN